MSVLDNSGEWVVFKRRGNKIRWRNTASAAVTPWQTAPEMGPGSRYDEARDRLLALL